MWANYEVCALARWMHERNLHNPKDQRAGFYGLDVYSLLESLESIIEHLKKVDGEEAVRSAENVSSSDAERKGGNAVGSLLICDAIYHVFRPLHAFIVLVTL